ncbi:MAG: hypothetical protein M3R41_05645 [Pseudomonadota bacterium]|nr:hypothetical protein [Pseudomonadota bacterium]
MRAHREDIAEQARLEGEASEDGMVTCDYCEGRFDRSDMDGDHCLDCAEELFGDEAP